MKPFFDCFGPSLSPFDYKTMSLPSTRNTVEQAVLVCKIQAASFSVVIGFLLIANLVSLYENRKVINFRSSKQKWRIPMMLATFCSFFAMTFAHQMMFNDWTGNSSGCIAITWIIAWLYATSKIFGCMFLYFRAKIVHESLHFSPRRSRQLQIGKCSFKFITTRLR